MLKIKDFLPKLGGEKLKSTKLIWECPTCSSENTLVAEVEAFYLKIFNVPFIPREKKINVHCSICYYQADQENLPENLKQVCSGILKNSRTPFRHYHLLIYLGLIISILLYWAYNVEPGLGDYLKDPKIGDIYLMSSDSSLTYFAMVTAVEQHFVYLASFKERPDSIYYLARINNSVQIKAVFTPYSREQLFNIYQAGVIHDVIRSDLPEGVKMYEKSLTYYKVEPKPLPSRKIPDDNRTTKIKKALPAEDNSH